MKIGITVDIRHSMFSAGYPNSCIAILEVFQGHDCVLVHKEHDKEWWDDVKTLSLPCLHINKVSNLDLLIEVAWFVSNLQRKEITKKSIWYCGIPCIFSELESSVYATRPEGRDLEGLHEIWLADLFNHENDVKYLELLYPSIKIRLVPWLWTSTIVETHRESMNSPVWLQVNEEIPEDLPWSLKISESNNSNTSSSIIPLVILKYTMTKYNLPISRVNVHNTEMLLKSKFFQENVLNQCSVKDLSANLVGRQRVIDWSHEPKSILLTHSRFVPLRMANLEAAWVGLPIIHNNTALRDLGHGLELLYYSGNNILEASSVLERVIRDHRSIPYLNNLDQLTELRNTILERFSPASKASEWNALLDTDAKGSELNILFTDMWADFNPEYNMFILALRNHIKNIKVVGTSNVNIKHDIHIFGPFGTTWHSIDGVKIHFTGENTEPIDHPLVKLNLGYKHLKDANYLRMPLWMLEIDWFQADHKKIRNPIPLPIDACMNVTINERKKFCAFVVSNPTNPIRNEAFETLNTYKPVDSAGHLFNNVGNVIFAGYGGGGGELKKHIFLKDYKFCLAYENSSSEGYTTEKLLHAKAAGCIPIYWGDPRVVDDFDPSGFIDLTDNPGSLLRRVRELEENPDLLLKMRSVPAISLKKRVEVLNTFQRFCEKTIEISKSLEPLLVTCSTAKFWPYLIQWLECIKLYKTHARVYVGHDVSERDLHNVMTTYTFANFIRFPTEVPDGFPDFWNPTHYAWKLWIYYTLSKETHRLIFYTDCASILIRWPTEWIQDVIQNKISFLNDSSQINRRWCHEDFLNILKVTEEEKDSNQVVGGILAFVSGDEQVKKFFSDAYFLACIRKVIVGEKWSGIKDGLPYGHRHDQSILSILSYRYKLKRYPLEKIYNDTSARSTYYNGQSIYVHRGDYKSHIPLLEGMDDAFVINLDRREDRKKAFLEYHPDLRGHVRRHVAIDGRNLSLTSSLARLFKPNDFFWKKSVMGCALSHLKLWTMLACEQTEIESYFIMEDDARLRPGWREAWKNAYKSLPSDWDCVYLGGILPPNREGFKMVLEKITPGLSRVAPHTFFGQHIPNRYFHFCAYAYVLSKRGARKIIDLINAKGGYWTSADHMICNEVDIMNLYILDPLVAGASQDDDPIYKTADFNNFSRVDNFDSDLWNNDERFSQDEININLKTDLKLDILGAVNEAMNPAQPIRFVSLGVTDTSLYEKQWLEELLGHKFVIERVKIGEKLHGNICVVLIRPEWNKQLQWLEEIRTYRNFKILHLSDEAMTDPISFYSWPEVSRVIRFYSRVSHSKILTIPLGYHWKNSKILDFNRKYIWSFHGTNWNNRSEALAPLESIKPKSVKYYSEWRDSRQLTEEEYMILLHNTFFVPCPGGNNIETYRFYEALECGCIPVFIEIPKVLLDAKIPFLNTCTWEEVKIMIEYFIKNPEAMKEYRKSILLAWSNYKECIKISLKQWINMA
jgi:GR25 family glycosyltransferase involved in LPS biosynthesis